MVIFCAQMVELHLLSPVDMQSGNRVIIDEELCRHRHLSFTMSNCPVIIGYALVGMTIED